MRGWSNARVGYYIIAMVLAALSGWRLGGIIAENYEYDTFINISPWPQIMVGAAVLLVLIGIGQLFFSGWAGKAASDAFNSAINSVAQTAYLVAALIATIIAALIIGGGLDRAMGQRISPIPQLFIGGLVGFFLLVGWRIIFMKNFLVHLRDDEILLKVHLYLPEMIFYHLRMPVSVLFKTLYSGVKTWKQWIGRTFVVFIGGLFIVWFVSVSEQLHEFWRIWWPVIMGALLLWYIVSWIVLIGVRYRGSGVIVSTTGEVWAVEMRFLNHPFDWWPSARILKIDFSKIDIQSMENVVNLPGLEPYVKVVDISFQQESGVAVTLRGLTLIDLDRISQSSSDGRIFADYLKGKKKKEIEEKADKGQFPS